MSRFIGHRVAVFFIALAATASGQTSSDVDMGVRLQFEAESEPPVWTLTWWGRAGLRYLVLTTPDLMEPWQVLPAHNPAGRDEILGVQCVATGTDMLFFRVIEYSPTNFSAASDADEDGMHDRWEEAFFGNGAPLTSDDGDVDGLTNGQEFVLGTDPTLADSDGDGLPDGLEVEQGLDPLTPYPAELDADGDGASDITELLNNTDRNNPDTDGDGLNDGMELAAGTNPLQTDVGLKIRYLATRLPAPSDLTWVEAMDLTNGGWVGGYGDDEALRWHLPTGRFDRAGGSNYTYGHAINESGTVVGEMGNVALRWTATEPPAALSLGLTQNMFSADINKHGWIAGDANVQQPGQTGAYVWKNAFTFLQPPAGFLWVEAWSLNDDGVVIGIARSSEPPYRVGVRWSPEGGVGGIVPHGQGDADLVSIAENGTILGETAGAAFLWSPTAGTQVLPFGGFSGSIRVTKNNAAGEVVGRIGGRQVVWRPTGIGEWEVIDLAQDILDPEVAASIWINSINDRGQLAGSFEPDGGTGSKPVVLTPIIGPVMAVDSNRDGSIDPADYFATSAEAPYRFWINDDDDELFDQSVPLLYDELSEDDRLVTSATEDWKDLKPDCARDLEDFARLQVHLGGLHEAVKSGQLSLGVKWGSGTSGNPSVRLHLQAETNGGSGYLFNASAASAQLDLSFSEAVLQITDGTNYLVAGSQTVPLPTRWFANLSGQNPKVNLLFEGGQSGMGELKFVILKLEGTTYTEIGEGPGVWLDLKRPNELVERYSCGDGDLGAVSPVYPHANSGQFPAPIHDEEKDYVLYVHGYNMDEFEKQRWIETTYKRLYWLGYKGRVGGFTWPCAQSFLPFDASEERAWASGAELKAHLQNLKTRGYRVHVLAHSQGNVVMGEALRQAGPGSALATTYIATQAAIAASAYNANAPQMPNPGNDTPDVYTVYPPTNRPYFDAAEMSGAAGRYVNFYNRNDYALSSTSGNLVSWEKDQELKPNNGYHWSVTNGFFKGLVPFQTSYTFPTDRFDIFSFCAEAKSLALGTIPTGGVFTGFTNLQSTQQYGPEHIYHSGQFRASMAERYRYWDGLLTHLGIPSLAP